MTGTVIVGVLALQGAFYEHVELLKQAAKKVDLGSNQRWDFTEVRTPQELGRCDALIIPGGESTTIALAATRSDLLEPLRDFVKYAFAFISFSWSRGTDFLLLQESVESQLGEPAPA